MDHPLVRDSNEGVTAVVEYDYKAKEVDELDLVKGQIIHNIIRQPGGWWEGTLASSGKTGMFPDNFVRVLDNNENSTVVLRDKATTIQRRCKAIYSYAQVNEDELSLAVGDIIEFLGEVEEGWWRGKLTGEGKSNKVGVFPSNFVVAMQSSPVFASKRPTQTVDVNASGAALKSTASVQKQHASNSAKSIIHSKEETLTNNRLGDASCDSNYVAPVLPPRPVREFCRVEFAYSPQNEDELELAIGEIIAIVNKDLPDKGWWKGEVNGKIGVFPDNFVKLIPHDESPIKDSRPPNVDAVTKTNNKKSTNSNSQNTNRLENSGSRDSLDDILNETGIQSGNVAAQRKSLENKNFELLTPSTSVDRSSRHIDLKSGETRKSMENLDEKKVPPPLLTKKPTVPGKKTSAVTNVAGNILSGLRQKVKNVEQKMSVSQDASDGVSSSKYNLETQDNSKKISNADKLLDGDSEFDKVERASMLPDMRAGRVKAPKRRPPSVAVNLMTESTTKNSIYLNGNDDSFDDSKTPNSADSDEQVKPKSREWEKKKVPWMDELKASQVKKKTSPYIEPRTTLVDANSKVVLEDKPVSPSDSTKNVIMNKKTVENNVATVPAHTAAAKPSTLPGLSVSIDKENESETDIAKPNPEVLTNKISAESNEIKSPPRTLPAKINVTKIHSQPSKPASTPVAILTDESNDFPPAEGPKIVQLEKRVQSLESTVQLQQRTIDELQKMLREEANRVEMLKNQLEKYAQCVTQV